IPLNEQLGDSASLTITRNGVTERTINGLIAGAEQGNTDGRRTFYIFTVRPTMWLMTLNQDSRIFHRQSVPEILTILLKEHRILFTRDTLYKRHVEREYTTQKRESAYDFWCRLAAEEGIVFWFEEKQTLFCDCRLGMQADIDLTYNTHPETDETDTTAYQWSYGEYLCSNGTVQKDHNFLNPKYSLEHQKQSDDSGRNSVFESYGRFQWDEEGKPFTQLRLEQLRNYSKVGTAKTHCIRLRPGKIFTLQSHPIEAMNDCWQVISVTHHGWQPVASNDGGEGTTLTNEVAFIPGRQDWRPPYRYKPLADGDEAVQGFQTLEVGQNQTVTIKGQQAISIGKNHQLNVADNQQI
ncbi:type VI secretion system tip protein TssI/VgrG, partial [Photorhabdus sp. HUG-39]